MALWTEEELTWLRQARHDGVTLDEAAARLGRTQPAVSRQLAKIGLSSGIGAGPVRARTRLAQVPTLPSMARDANADADVDAYAYADAARVRAEPSSPVLRTLPGLPPPAAIAPVGPASTCQNPRWPNGAKPPRPPAFCGARSRPCYSWCEDCFPVMLTRKQLSAPTQKRLCAAVGA